MNTLPETMSADDRQFVINLIETYANAGQTGARPVVSPEDRARADELIAKYKIKINRNPRPIKSRYAKVFYDSSQGAYVRSDKEPSRRDIHREYATYAKRSKH